MKFGKIQIFEIQSFKIDNSNNERIIYHLLNPYYMQNTSYVFSVTITLTHKSQHLLFSFTYEGPEAQRGQGTDPQSHSQQHSRGTKAGLCHTRAQTLLLHSAVSNEMIFYRDKFYFSLKHTVLEYEQHNASVAF